ncbi:MAG: hypothetical protein AAFR12_12430 [Cyanobacteria bacterium J06626_6]
MQAPEDSSPSTLSSTSHAAQKRLGSQPGLSRRHGTLAGTAAFASAGFVFPLVGGDAALANPSALPPMPGTAPLPEQAIAPNQLSPAAYLSQSEGVAPQVGQARQAAFSHSPAAAKTSRTHPAQSSAPSATQAPLLRQGSDGNWTLAYSGQNAQQTQQVVAQVAEQAAAARQSCNSDDCRRLTYIDQQLPAARKVVQDLAQRLTLFSAERGQSNMPAYKEVLSDRITEISNQKSALSNDLAETRNYISQLEMRLSTVEADLTLPARLLSQDTTYQSIWADLQSSEEKLQSEYSKANIDATLLNQIYTEYQEQQQQLERAAYKALNLYIMDEQSPAPAMLYQAPAALDVLQALVVATHQESVQKLRQDTIGRIESRLQSRQRQLAQDITTHEQIERELTSAKAVVTKLEEERDRLNSNRTAEALSSPVPIPESTDLAAPESSPESPAIAAARSLEVQLPEGTVAKTLMGIVVAAGGAAALAYRKQQQKKQISWQLRRATATTRPAVTLQPATFSSSRADRLRGTRDEQGMLAEMMAITGQSATETTEVPSQEALDRSIEIMAQELEQALNRATAEPSVVAAKPARKPEPVRLSLDEIDLFAQHAIRWVLKDLGEGLFMPAVPGASLKAAVSEKGTLGEGSRPEVFAHPGGFKLVGQSVAGPRFAFAKSV